MIRYIAIAIAFFAAAHLAEARKKPAMDPTSRFMCENLKVGCPKKAPRAKSVKKKKRVTKAKTAAKQAAPAPEPKPLAAAPVKPLPKPSPPRAKAAAPEQEKAAAPEQEKPAAPEQEKPAAPEQDLALIVPPKPAAKPDAGESLETPREDRPQGDDGAACRAELVKLGAGISVPRDMVGGPGCTVANPVTLKSLRTTAGTISLPGNPILNCVFAKQFATWLGDVAAPVVAAHEDASLASVSTGPGYQCRGRNGDASAKMSEHAFGNAIDIDGLVIAGKKRIDIASVGDPVSPDHRVLMALRISACGYFTTVLGPGSNSAHATHYHFDLGLHGKSGNYRICE